MLLAGDIDVVLLRAEENRLRLQPVHLAGHAYQMVRPRIFVLGREDLQRRGVLAATRTERQPQLPRHGRFDERAPAGTVEFDTLQPVLHALLVVDGRGVRESPVGVRRRRSRAVIPEQVIRAGSDAPHKEEHPRQYYSYFP